LGYGEPFDHVLFAECNRFHSNRAVFNWWNNRTGFIQYDLLAITDLSGCHYLPDDPQKDHGAEMGMGAFAVFFICL
jgi:hypothetical protein